MDAFTFKNPTKILFGKGREQEVGAEAAAYGKKVLLHYGGGSIKASGLYETVTASLKASGITIYELSGVKPNPRLSLVKEGIAICREQGIELILAVGGGSVIDSAKAIAIGVPYAGDVWDFYTRKATPQKALPIGTVLTIPAAGSESSDGSVITNEEGWLKRACGSEHIYPAFSILNPELAYTLPTFQIGCGVADMLAHLMERYFTNTKQVELTDRLIEGTMKTIIANGPKLMKNPKDYDAWSEIFWSGTIAHNNILNTGRESDWGSHGIEHEISGIYDVAHGAGLAVVFPAWMKYVLDHDVQRFAQMSVRVWNKELSVWDLRETALQGIAELERFFETMGLPTRLSGLGIVDDRLEEMADKATNGDTTTLGHFVPMDKKAVRAILELAK